MSDLYFVSGLHVYPVKSLAGIAMQEVALTPTGFKHDRRWMLIDEQARFISQREFHQLCLFSTHFTSDGFKIRHHKDELTIPFSLNKGIHIRAAIWNDVVDVIQANDTINDWFSQKLAEKVRLVYLPDQSRRPVDEKYRVGNEIVSLADGYPLLTIGEASLALLQSKITETIPMNRFRPNLVFTGGKAHDEDYWKEFMINGQTYYGVKPCARCVVTTIDQKTGEAAAEPLKTLANYRKIGNKILFGQNVISPVYGKIRLGDTIHVVAERG